MGSGEVTVRCLSSALRLPKGFRNKTFDVSKYDEKYGLSGSVSKTDILITGKDFLMASEEGKSNYFRSRSFRKENPGTLDSANRGVLPNPAVGFLILFKRFSRACWIGIRYLRITHPTRATTSVRSKVPLSKDVVHLVIGLMSIFCRKNIDKDHIHIFSNDVVHYTKV